MCVLGTVFLQFMQNLQKSADIGKCEMKIFEPSLDSIYGVEAPKVYVQLKIFNKICLET